MTSEPGKQIIPIHILPNTSRSKGNKIMKFGYLIEYSMINIFVEKSYTRSFSKNSKLCFYLGKESKILYS